MSIQITIIITLLLLSSFFSASETALTGANRIRLKHKAEKGNKTARRALKLVENYDSMLIALLITNNVVNIAVSSLTTVFAIQFAVTKGINDSIAVTVSTAIITVILIMFGEILPKTLAKENADGFILITSSILNILMIIFKPISIIILFLQKRLSGIFSKSKKQASITEEELMHIIDEIEEEGVLEEHESSLVRSALEFDETTVEKILTPRVDMTAVSLTDNAEEIFNVFLEEGYSRLPVYDKTADNIIGVISHKEFMKWFLAKYVNAENNNTSSSDAMDINSSANIHDIVRDIIRIPALMRLSDALKLLQKEKAHIALVLDQHGGTDGIVTLEDILEELVGEIWDEEDEEKNPIRFTGEGTFEAKGDLSVIDFNRAFEVYSGIDEIEGVTIKSEYNTVGGWVLDLFEKIPKVGDTFESKAFKIKVLSMDKRRIGRLLFEVKRKNKN